jgi:hypothetical protein
VQASPSERLIPDGWIFSLRGRVNDVGGDFADGGLTYGDFFHSGYGASLELRRGWKGEDSSGIALWGGLGFDRYSGRTYGDALGDTLTPDALQAVSLAAGGSAFLMFEDGGGDTFGGELFLGVGALWTPGVDADFVVGGTPVGGELIDGGASALFDLGLRFGVAGRRFAFNVGFRLRWSGAFDAGDDVTGVIDPDPLIQYSFEFGWEYRL